MPVKLDGFTRFRMTRRWLKNRHEIDKEEYIRKLCEKVNVVYVPPIDVDRSAVITKSANMFPTRK